MDLPRFIVCFANNIRFLILCLLGRYSLSLSSFFIHPPALELLCNCEVADQFWYIYLVRSNPLGMVHSHKLKV